MKFFIVLYISLSFLLLSTPSRALNSGSKVTLTGLVYREYFYQQPNYGDNPDTDAIVGECMFKIDAPILFENNKISRVSLEFIRYPLIICTNLIGHRVQLTGKMYSPETGHQEGDAFFEVTKFELLR